jgi:opacity protein-like surface antigen
MKKTIVALLLFLLLTVIAYPQDEAVQTQTYSSVNVVYGFRMQSDMTFYVEVGALLDQADIIAGIGWNNAIWVGAHKYFYSNNEFTAFSGIELHILYPKNATLELHPALPIGFALVTGDALFIVESLIYPNFEGESITVKFGISFLFKL